MTLLYFYKTITMHAYTVCIHEKLMNRLVGGNYAPNFNNYSILNFVKKAIKML